MACVERCILLTDGQASQEGFYRLKASLQVYFCLPDGVFQVRTTTFGTLKELWITVVTTAIVKIAKQFLNSQNFLEQ